MSYKQFVDGLANELQECSARVQRQFSSCTPQQLNWKPAADSWSIAQCLQHLIVSNELYYQDMDAIAHDRYTMSGYLKTPLLPTFFGSMLVYSLKRPSMKSKTVKHFEPTQSEIEPEILSLFSAHNEQLISKMRTIQDKQLKSLVVRSAFADRVIYSAYDMLRILVVHEQRHIGQAERVMARDNFPR